MKYEFVVSAPDASLLLVLALESQNQEALDAKTQESSHCQIWLKFFCYEYFLLKIILNGNPVYHTKKGAAALFEGVLWGWMDRNGTAQNIISFGFFLSPWGTSVDSRS